MQTLTRMRHAQRETEEEKQDTNEATSNKDKDTAKSDQSSKVKKSTNVPDEKSNGAETLTVPKYIRNSVSITSRKEIIPRRRGQQSGRGGGKGRGKGRGRGKATGSIPVLPVEIVEARGRMGPREVVLSESSSSSDSEDEKAKPKQRGGFL